ncbi:MAG: hypothetical protein KDD69_17790 [Bdellovibrionales bacterium]|nr:hypothetical protein [Bdellovibrionales bacterium]
MYRSNWLTVLIFRIATLCFFIYFLQSQLVSSEAVIFPAIVGLLGAMFFGWMTAIVAGSVLAPVLQAQIDLFSGIGRAASKVKAGASTSEAQRLQAFVDAEAERRSPPA